MRVAESARARTGQVGREVVAVIDPDPRSRRALSSALKASGYLVSTFGSGREFLHAPFVPGCVVSDFALPDMSGLELVEILKDVDDPRPVAFTTAAGSVDCAVTALKSGAVDYVEKNAAPERIVEAVRLGLRIGASRLERRAGLAELRDRYASLSERQKVTMSFIVQGLPNKEVAARLGISPRTVEIYRSSVMSKMGAMSFADLVRMSIRLSLA